MMTCEIFHVTNINIELIFKQNINILEFSDEQKLETSLQ
jgi:hypothetical protein